MIGLIVKYMDKIYKVGTPGEGVTLSSLHRTERIYS